MPKSKFKENLRVNRYELAELLESHTDRFMDCGEAWSEAIAERDELKVEADVEKAMAKDEMEKTRAKLDLEFRRNWRNYDLKKAPTDKTVESLVMSSDILSEAKKKYYETLKKYGMMLSDAEYHINILKSGKEAYDHRKSALDNLTRLMVSGYYSCKLPAELKEDVMTKREERMEERARETTNETMSRRRRGQVKNE
jgi:hypothetical protein